ncbi:MAG: hypothetical protein AAGI66_05510 [Cyanobacteria bacterium P01_H01_bin.74]
MAQTSLSEKPKPPATADYQALKAAEAGIVWLYQKRVLQRLWQSLALRNPYKLQTFPETLSKLGFSLHYARLQKQRARFNTQISQGLPGEKDFLRPYLPFWASIQNVPRQLAVYQDCFHQVRQAFQFFDVTYYDICCEKTPSADWSTITLFCMQVLEVFRNRLDCIAQLTQDRPHGFHVQFCTQTLSTYYEPGYIQINPITVWGETVSEQSPGVTHTLIHILSYNAQQQETETFPDMSASQQALLTAAASQLKAQFLKNDIHLAGIGKTILNNTTSVGFNGYAFIETQPEFLTTAIENCLKRPKAVQKTLAGCTIFDFFTRYFGWDNPLRESKGCFKQTKPEINNQAQMAVT